MGNFDLNWFQWIGVSIMACCSMVCIIDLIIGIYREFHRNDNQE